MPKKPTLTWIELSEIVVGRLLTKKMSPEAVDAAKLIDDYQMVVPLLKRKAKLEQIIEAIGLPAYQAALDAAQTYKADADYATLLVRASNRAEVGSRLARFADKLQQGEQIDVSSLFSLSLSLSEEIGMLRSLADIVPEKEPFVKTGWAPLDTHIGGLPKAGLTLVGAPPGTGKTSLMVQLASSFARRGKKSVLFSLEMTAAQLAMVFVQKSRLTKAQKSLIYVCEDILTPTELASIASRVEDAELVGVDFAELMLSDEISEQTMSNAYRSLAWLARNKKVPTVVLSQLNRGGGVNIHRYRYSGMAEALTALGLLIHNPNQILGFDGDEGDDRLPGVAGKAYVVGGKSRYGWVHGGPGAILCDWDGEAGWGSRSEWIPLGPIVNGKAT
jgi:replicative DNA helicase